MDDADRPSAGATRHPVAFAACLVAATLVHAGAIAWAVDASTVRPGALSGSPAAAQAVTLVSISDTPPAPDWPGTAPGGKASAPVPAHTPHASAPSAPVVARTVRPVVAPDAAPATVFYGFHDVDEPAFPDTDWNVDVDTLSRLGVQRLVFEVFVSDHGEVVGCSVLEPSDLPDELKRTLEQRIADTTLLPARRAGEPVASRRLIEMTTDSTPGP